MKELKSPVQCNVSNTEIVNSVMPDQDFNRAERVASAVRKVLGTPINELAKAHSVALATITSVELSPDLRKGVVFLSVYGDDAGRDHFLKLIDDASHDLQTVVARSLRTKRTPVLSFRIDDALERGDRINRLLDKLPENMGEENA